MNRKRCPWCGKRIDKAKDRGFCRNTSLNTPVRRMLYVAKCSHCGYLYGQVPAFPYGVVIGGIFLLGLVLSLVFRSGVLLFVAVLSLLLFRLTPYSRLNNEGKACKKEPDLLCEFTVIEKYGRIRRGGLYFLDDRFDRSGPFSLASPVQVRSAPGKSGTVRGRFLYRQEKNRDAMKTDGCVLYDSGMNRVARIKFVTDKDTDS